MVEGVGAMRQQEKLLLSWELCSGQGSQCGCPPTEGVRSTSKKTARVHFSRASTSDQGERDSGDMGWQRE